MNAIRAAGWAIIFGVIGATAITISANHQWEANARPFGIIAVVSVLSWAAAMRLASEGGGEREKPRYTPTHRRK